MITIITTIPLPIYFALLLDMMILRISVKFTCRSPSMKTRGLVLAASPCRIQNTLDVVPAPFLTPVLTLSK